MRSFSTAVAICSIVLTFLSIGVDSFISPISLRSKCSSSSPLKMSMQDNILSEIPRFLTTLQLADTSVSEEEVINTIGQAGDLPDPFLTVLAAAVIVLGVAFLQFSLGDLTKEEGQARVRDFLQTRKDTERKRGYFD